MPPRRRLSAHNFPHAIGVGWTSSAPSSWFPFSTSFLFGRICHVRRTDKDGLLRASANSIMLCFHWLTKDTATIRSRSKRIAHAQLDRARQIDLGDRHHAEQ